MAYMDVDNFIDDDELKDYPYDGFFYTTEIDNSLPLDEQEEVEVPILECKCDITEASHARVNGFIKAVYSIFVPFCPKCQTIVVNRGNLFRAWQHGVLIKGTVEGVFPSQLGGFVCYVQADEIENKNK
jgi:hypothetical protein